MEEYAPGNVLTEKYLQGYHGLVKTFVNNIYYYQDELGSTSHVADANGALLEYYKYDLYGKPKFFDANNNQLSTSNYSVADLGDGGARWIPQIGLYDDRNRFMSPDLGRFLQPDPIGFKGDASNLYRYVGNDWANRVDPWGLQADINMFGPGSDRTAGYPFGKQCPSEPGVLIVTGHGTPYGMKYLGQTIGAEEISKLIMSNKAFKDAQTIRIISCCVGDEREVKKGTVLAQKIANITGKTVEAPTDKVLVAADGTYSVEHGGKMKTFSPDNQKRNPEKKNSKPTSSNSNSRSSSPSVTAGIPAAWGLSGSRPAPIYSGGALGGGTAWGQQANGSFVDPSGSNLTLAGDMVGAQAGVIHPVPKSLY